MGSSVVEKQESECFPATSLGAKTRQTPKKGRTATTFVDQLESDPCLTRQDLASIMANRLDWDRLIKSVQVRPKEIDRPYSYSTFFSLIVVLQFYLNNFNTRLTALLKNQ